MMSNLQKAKDEMLYHLQAITQITEEIENDRNNLRKAIGVCVPSIIRCFMTYEKNDEDRIMAQRVLERVNAAVEASEELDKKYQKLIIELKLKDKPITKDVNKV